jgi:hypothetical protein
MPPFGSIWECSVCTLRYVTRVELRNHLKLHTNAELIQASVNPKQLLRRCGVCEASFTTSETLSLHRRESGHWPRHPHACGFCHMRFATFAEASEHTEQRHFQGYSVVDSAFDRKLETVEKIFPEGEPAEMTHTVDMLFANEESELHSLMQAYLFRHKSCLIHLVVVGRFVRYDSNGDVMGRALIPLRTSNATLVLHDRHRINKIIRRFRGEINERVESLELSGTSTYSLENIASMQMMSSQVRFAGGATFKTRQKKKQSGLTQRELGCVLDVPSHITNGCLFTSVAQAFLSAPNKAKHFLNADSEARHAKNVSEWEGKRALYSKHYVDKYVRMKGIPTPVPISKLRKFEGQNKHLNLALNVFMFDEVKGRKNFFPIYISKRSKADKPNCKPVNLLLMRRRGGKSHFVYISDFDRLMNRNIGRHKRCCLNCLGTFSGPAALSKHQRLCFENDAQKVQMPTRGEKVVFKSFSKQSYQPIMGFLDFEASQEEREGTDSGFDVSETVEITRQKPSTYALVFLSCKGDILFQRVFSSDTELLADFYATLFECEKKLLPLLNDCANTLPILTPAQLNCHDRAVKCYLCDRPFSDLDPKVLDHSHSSLQDGRYLGAAHRSCNLKCVHQRKISVWVHNFSNYDSHFILQGLADPKIVQQIYKLAAIPYNTQKFRTLTLNGYRFLDSMQFLSNSLANLTEELRISNHEFKLLDKFDYKGRPPCGKDLLLRKSVYPYEWAKCAEQLRYTTMFPPPSAFENKLNGTSISVEDYTHGQRMYTGFGCKNFLEYCEIYCLLDTLQLAEVVCNFRETIYNEFQLDCAHFMSTPQLAFDIMLKVTGVEIELIHDNDMVLMVESGLRGGVSYVATRHAAVPPDYDPATTPGGLLYIDANNLYGYCMMSHLPLKDFKWMWKSDYDKIDWLAQREDQDVGYILEVDLEYPPELHDKHDSMPLCPEKYEIDADELSRYSTYCHTAIHGGKPYSASKLCGTLHAKKRYTIHYTYLKLCLEEGMILSKVHRVIKFTQAPFLKDYIENMTQKRKEATTEVKRSLYKYLINSIYGKMAQAVRKYLTVKFILKEHLLNRYLTHPCHMSHRIIGPTCVAFFRKDKTVTLDKPYAVGFSILEKSKRLMGGLYYKFIQPALGGHENVNVLMSDTDSLVLQFGNQVRADALEKLKPVMDFSNYPKLHPLYDPTRKSVPGFFKDENAGTPLIELAALRAKCYAMRTLDKSTTARCKGIKKTVVKEFKIDMYKNCLAKVVVTRAVMHRIQARNFKISTLRIRKVCMSSFDDKRHIHVCGLHSLAYGSWRIGSDTFCPQCAHNAMPDSSVV